MASLPHVRGPARRSAPFLVLAVLLLAGCAGTPSDDSRPGEASSTDPSTTHEGTGPSTGSPNGTPSSPTPSPSPSAAGDGSNGSGPGEPTGTSGGGPFAVDQYASTRAWGDAAQKTVRPGVDVVGGGQCTSNFLFHLHDERYFLGVAAHCFQATDGTEPPFYESCPTPAAMAPGAKATLYGTDNRAYEGTLVYSSFWTMNQNREADGDTCAANDFALVELPRSMWDRVHPSVLGWGGPTALGDPDQVLSSGDTLYAYGNSDTRPTWALHGEGFESSGPFQAYAAGGWGIVGGPMFLPLVPGDSGGPAMNEQGHAYGALSVLNTLEGSMRWTNIARALWYMQEHEGWAPSMVTWNDFSP